MRRTPRLRSSGFLAIVVVALGGCLGEDSPPTGIAVPPAGFSVGTGPAPFQPVAGPSFCPKSPSADHTTYRDLDLVRRDLTEDQPGMPLKLMIRWRDTRCQPLSHVEVDAWHADAFGRYSGIDGPAADTFLRGSQYTDSSGVVVFETVFPGWPAGRAPHVQVLARHDGTAPLVVQETYFPDAVAASAYAAAPYSSRPPDTASQSDPGKALPNAAVATVSEKTACLLPKLNCTSRQTSPYFSRLVGRMRENEASSRAEVMRAHGGKLAVCRARLRRSCV